MRETARRLNVPLAAEFDTSRKPELLDRFELFMARKKVDARLLKTHEELLIYFREFAHARGIPWRVAMTVAVEEWMRVNRRRKVVRTDPEAVAAGVLVPERICEGAQLALQRMRE